MKRRGAAVAAAVASTCLVATMAPAFYAANPASAANSTTPRRFLSGWMPYWSTSTSTTSFLTNSDLFRAVSPFWHDARWDGSKVYIKDHLSASTAQSTLRKLQGQDVKILPSITDGTGKGRMAKTLSGRDTRAVHVKSIVDLVLDRGYDGIDLDYETFAFTDGSSTWSATRPDWVKFVDELAAALHAEGKLLSVTVPAMTDKEYWVYDYAAMGKSADYVRIMAYDYSVSSPGPIAPLSWVKKVAAFAGSQIPKDKVELGIPVYGRNWYTGKTGTCPVGQSIKTSNYAMTGANALQSLAEDGVSPGQATRGASGELSVSYEIVYRGLDGDGQKTSCTVKRTAYFADATSVADRVRVAREAGLGGAALWTIGGESSAQWPAVRSAVGTAKDDPGAQKIANVKIGAPRFVTRGQKASYTATVTVDGKPSPGGSATLQSKAKGTRTWRKVATRKVPTTGKVVFQYAPRSSAAFRVGVSSTGARKAVRSAVVTTKVRPRVSVKSSVIAFAGRRVTLAGSVTPAAAGVTVTRQRLVDGQWQTTGSTKVRNDGSYSFHVTPTVSGVSYTYRIVTEPFDGYGRGYSSTLSFRPR